MSKVYVCIASKETLANLIPAIIVKPDVVWIISSETMVEKAQQLAVSIESALPNCELHNNHNLPDTSFESMSDFALNIAISIEQAYPDSPIIYNGTGGTKLMFAAFQEAFWDHQICYADTQHDQLLYLRPEHTRQPFSNELNIKDYLLANGLDARKALSDSEEWRQSVEERKALTFWLAKNTEHLQNFFPQLNGLVAGAVYEENRTQKLSSQASHLKCKPKGKWEESLEKFQSLGLIDREDNLTFRFQNLEAAKYIGGQWIEEYVWLVANNLNCHDVACGLEITTQKHHKDNIRNELDCVICHHNRMVIVECKTSQFGKKEQKDSEILYKIDSIGGKVGGVFGERLLISALPLDHVTSSNRSVKNSSRAETMSINLLDGKNIIQLETMLKNWIDSGKLIV
jgi:hypothetical protein